jgi:hypothetical protein
MNSATVRKISNGFVVTTFPGSVMPSGPVDTYCVDMAAVTTLLTTALAS